MVKKNKSRRNKIEKKNNARVSCTVKYSNIPYNIVISLLI